MSGTKLEWLCFDSILGIRQQNAPLPVLVHVGTGVDILDRNGNSARDALTSIEIIKELHLG